MPTHTRPVQQIGARPKRKFPVRWGNTLMVLSGSLIAVFCGLCSCSKEQQLLNEKRGKSDLGVFLFSEIQKYGGANIAPTNVPASGITDYTYSEDRDGFQLLCKGNKVIAIQKLFQPYFGDPFLAATNGNGLSAFVYSVRQVGVAVDCGLDSQLEHGLESETTHLVVVKASALR